MHPTEITMESLKIFGLILGLILSSIGLLLNAYSQLKRNSYNRLLSYQELTKSHREIWKMTIDTPDKFKRIFENNIDLESFPITYHEKTFIHLVLLHMTASFYFSQKNSIIKIEQLKYDFYEFLSLPLPLHVWNETKRYFNNDFIVFIENTQDSFCGEG